VFVLHRENVIDSMAVLASKKSSYATVIKFLNMIEFMT